MKDVKRKFLMLVLAWMSVHIAFAFRDFVPYHGMRIPKETEEFCIKDVFGSRSSNGERVLFEITMRFSMPIDPRTVSGKTVLLNGKECDENVFFHYGRRGESIRITIVDSPEKKYSVEFKELASFDGKKLMENKISDIEDGISITSRRR